MDGINDISPAYQGLLFTMNDPLELPNISGLQPGSYAFYFGMDTTLNGLVDGTLTYDRIEFMMVGSDGYAFPLVDTGQTTCYDNSGEAIDCPEPGEAFSGQDAQYAGNQMSYTDNNDGTVTDNATGLMWQQADSGTGLDWEDALAYAENSNLQISHGSKGENDGWIPAIKNHDNPQMAERKFSW